MSNSIEKSKEYKDWINEISSRYRNSQIKASVKVNDEMLRLYWSIGRDLNEKKESSSWGSHFYEYVSRDLKFLNIHVKVISNCHMDVAAMFVGFSAVKEVSAINSGVIVKLIKRYAALPQHRFYLIPEWGHSSSLPRRGIPDRISHLPTSFSSGS